MFIHNREFLKKINQYNTIYIYDNNCMEQRINYRGEDKVKKIISVNSLKDEIDFMNSKNLDFFIEKGLDKKADPKSTLCILKTNKENKKVLISYIFNYSNNIEDNDIPFYHKNAPEKFSLFCTQDEYIQILEHIQTEEYQKYLIKKQLKKEESEILKTEPEPNDKAFICQVCKLKFDNYKEHIVSYLHLKNRDKYSNSYIRLKQTFNRLFSQNKKSNSNNLNLNLDNTKLSSNNMNITSIPENENKNETTIIYDNDIKTGKKSDNNVADKNDETKDISVKDILNILDTIQIQKDFVIKNLKCFKRMKRKKNQINKYYKNIDYIQDLKICTGKIGSLYKLYITDD